MNVLLVEDDQWLAEVEAKVLEDAGHEVRVAPHALAAIDSIDEAMPDVIILDVLLAGSTAFSLLNEVRSHSDISDTPIILCTNLAEQFDTKQLAGYGVRRVVDKTTMHPSDLIAAVRAVVGQGEGDADVSN